MSQSIALQIRTPTVSLADIEAKAQRAQLDEYRIRDMQRKDVLGQIDTQQQLDKARAIDDYRMRAGNGDPQADEALNAYPEDQKKLWDVFDGMSPEQYKKSSAMAQAFGAAARRVSSFAEGTPEQGKAWNDEITKLFDGGFIDQKTRDNFLSQGPNMNIINEALSLGKWAESYTGKNAVNRARAENYEGKTENEAALTQARIGTEKSKAELNATRGTVAEENVNSLDSYRQGTVKQKADAAAAETERKTLGQEAETERKTAAGRAETTRKAQGDARESWRKKGTDEAELAAKIEQGYFKPRAGKGSKEIVPGAGENGSGLDNNEYGRRIRDIQTKLEKRREEENLSDDELVAVERELRKKYNIPDSVPSITSTPDPKPAGGKTALQGSGGGAPDGSRTAPFRPKNRKEAEAVSPGQWFVDPKGNLVQRQ